MADRVGSTPVTVGVDSAQSLDPRYDMIPYKYDMVPYHNTYGINAV